MAAGRKHDLDNVQAHATILTTTILITHLVRKGTVQLMNAVTTTGVPGVVLTPAGIAVKVHINNSANEIDTHKVLVAHLKENRSNTITKRKHALIMVIGDQVSS